MKNYLILFLMIVIRINSWGQIVLEPGYFIDKAGQKTDCLIKNLDWKNNPIEFQYQVPGSETMKTEWVGTVNEFGIYGASKYKRFIVNVDKAREDVKSMSQVRDPEYVEEEVFLKVLVEGKATLLLYEDGNLIKFFYTVDGSNAEQLLYKKYLITEGQMGENMAYKQQLWNSLKCPAITMGSIENMNYRRKELINLFIKYNQCTGETLVDYTKRPKGTLFQLTARPGINNASLKISNAVNKSADTKFDDKLSFRFGLEAAFILPYNKNKWAILIEPTYQSYKAKKEVNSLLLQVNYSSFQVPIGVRHYFFLNENSKLFLNGSYVFDLPVKSEIHIGSGAELKVNTSNNFAFGAGYNHNNKLSLELRYGLSRKLLVDYAFWKTNFSTLSLIFGYTLF